MTTLHDEEHHAHIWDFCNLFDIVISVLLVCKIIDANNVTEIILKRPLISLVVSLLILFIYLFFFFVVYQRTMPFLVFLGEVCPITVKAIPNLIAFYYDCIFITYTPCID